MAKKFAHFDFLNSNLLWFLAKRNRFREDETTWISMIIICLIYFLIWLSFSNDNIRLDNIHSSWRSKGTGTRDRSTIHRKYGSFGDYLPLPVGEKFKSSPLKDRRATKQPLPSGHLAPEIERWGNEVKAKVRSGYYGSKPIFDQI